MDLSSNAYSIPWIKICGLTQKENALEVAKLNPDAIGFVFYTKSPRNVSIDETKKIIQSLPDHIEKIGVFVDESITTILDIVNTTGLTGVQLHGDEPPDMIERLQEKGLKVIKALFAARAPYLKDCHRYNSADAVLLEYGKGVLPGGNAESWNYELSSQLNTELPIILAGGLSARNVNQAIQNSKPQGVDISSKVESIPGVKDIHKVKAFINAVRSASGLSSNQ